MEINGIIRSISEIELISETFSKVELILDTSTYEQGTAKKQENAAKLQFCNAHINKLQGFTTGERVRVYFTIYGKEITTQDGRVFFNQNLNAYKIERI